MSAPVRAALGHRWRALGRELVKVRDLLAPERHDQPAGRRATGRSVLAVTTLRRVGPVGANTHIAQTVDLLEQRGRRVEVVSLDSWVRPFGFLLLVPAFLLRRNRLAFRAGILVDRSLTRLSVELAVRRRIRTDAPTVIYAQDPRSAAAALRARGRLPIPVVMVVHFNESEAEELINEGTVRPGGYADRSVRRSEAHLLPRLDGLVLVSDFMRRHLVDAVPAACRVPSAIIPNFLADRDAPPDEVLRDCISIGYLVERKNHAFLLSALAAANRLGHRYTLTVVGGGPEHERLVALAERLGVADQVSFLGQRFDVDPLLREHRLYLHSAAMENCPFAILEAFRAGRPVLTSQVGGIPELIGEEGAGRFWDHTDPEAGARARIAMLEDDAALDQAGKEARIRFETRYDADVVGDELITFLDSVSPGPGPGHLSPLIRPPLAPDLASPRR